MSKLKLINYLTLLITFTSLFVFYFIVTDIYKEKTYPDHIHKSIYIDRSFNYEEQEVIMRSAWQWSEATNHIIEFDVILLPAHEKIHTDNSLVIIKASVDYPDVIILDGVKHTKTLGYYDNKSFWPYIALVEDRLDDDTFGPVVLHELGHSLGLEHVDGPEGWNTLMYPYVDLGSDHITEKDLEQFCELYHCDPKKLQH